MPSRAEQANARHLAAANARAREMRRWRVSHIIGEPDALFVSRVPHIEDATPRRPITVWLDSDDDPRHVAHLICDALGAVACPSGPSCPLCPSSP
jgi:hypothetical protein